MRAAALLAMAAAIIAGPAGAQTDPMPETLPLKFETPTLSMIGRSPMRLFEQHNWIDIAYVRSMGVKVEPALPGLEDRALRIDSALALRIEGGRILRIFDQPEVMSEAGPVVHRFHAWLPGARFYVVSVICNECSTTYLIDQRDGSVADIKLPPVMSPSGQLGIVWMQDFMGGFFGGPPFVVDFRSHPPVMRIAPGHPNCDKRGQPTSLRQTPIWIDEAHIRFEGGTPMPSDDPNARQILKIASGKLAWDC